MVQFNKKRKFFNLFQTQLKNEINLERKNNKRNKKYLPPPPFKAPKVLYDSGWISVEKNEGGNIVGPSINQDEFAFGQLNYFADPTTVKDQDYPIDLFFFL